jgi:uncharacterized protein (TIGR02186 family)
MRVLLIVLLLLVGLPAKAAEIIGGLSQNRVQLTMNFAGSEILIFGAIRRDAPRFENEPPFDIIITIEGPPQPVVIWRKARRMGIWVNVESVQMASVPSFYAVATTGRLRDILDPEQDAHHRISPLHAIRSDQAIGDVADPEAFTQALMRLRAEAGQLQMLERWVYLDRETLFRVSARLPANLTEGAYTVRMYLIRAGGVVHVYRNAIFVRKEGLERWLHTLAYDQPLGYGLLALVIALVAGWGASTLFRYMRG